jgi:hypothetical protein
MRGFIWAAGLVLAASPAWGQTANNPTFTREQQGGSVVSGQITCASTSTSVYAGNGDARAIVISAADANGVYVCVQTGVSAPATPAPCTAATASVYLGAAGQNVVFDRSVKGVSVSCLRSAASDAKINYIVQK